MFVANGTVGGGNATITVESGGTLQGSGSVDNVVVQSGGHLAPGNSIESLSMSSLTLNSGADVFFEFKNAAGTTPGTDWDLIDLGGGTLTINADNADPANQIKLHIDSWKLDNSGHGGGLADGVNYNNFNAAPGTAVGGVQEYDWLFIAAGNINVVDAFPGSIGGRFQVIDDANGAGVFGTGNPFARPGSSMGQGTFIVRQGAGGLYVHYSAIPEPGSLLLAGLASAGIGWYGRRKKRSRGSVVTGKPLSE